MAPGPGSLLLDVATTADDVDAVMVAVSGTLRSWVGAGPVFLAPADPVTGVFAGTFLFDVPLPAAHAFAEIESAGGDLASFAELAGRTGDPVAALYAEAGGDPTRSERWREVITPLHWGDELRAVVRAHGRTWGYLCLHREAGERPFGARDAARLAGLLPAIGAALRGASALATRDPADLPTGVVLADLQGRITAITGGGAAWLAELGPAPKDELPITLAAVAALAAGRGTTISTTVVTASGRAAFVEAAPLNGTGPLVVAVAISAPPPDLAFTRLAAAAELTPRETEVVSRVLQGLSTRAIADALSISPSTVQAHLTSVFAKTGTRSRRELVGRLWG